jgi:HAD superfamily hydrolase (TIGR01509 family)
MASRYAVGFDFDHTLGLDNQVERTVFLEMLASFAHENAASYDLAAAEGAVDDALHSYRTGTLTPEIAIAGFLERFVPVHRTPVTDTAHGFRDAVLAAAPGKISILAGARETLAALAAMDVPVAILTNGWSPLQEEKARTLGFEGSVFVSERIGARKPSPEAFAHLVTTFARPPADIFYVGDDPVADCAGAREAGLRSVWFDWEQRPYPADTPAPEFTIHALAELPALLRDA